MVGITVGINFSHADTVTIIIIIIIILLLFIILLLYFLFSFSLIFCSYASLHDRLLLQRTSLFARHCSSSQNDYLIFVRVVIVH